jgi:hypothetical protein
LTASGISRGPPDVRSNAAFSVKPTSASDRRHLCDPHGRGLMRVASAPCDRMGASLPDSDQPEPATSVFWPVGQSRGWKASIQNNSDWPRGPGIGSVVG